MTASLEIFGLEEIYWFSVAALLPPGTLTEGDHQLTTTVTDPIFGEDAVTVDFHVLSC
jgi:hypothetical protein